MPTILQPAQFMRFGQKRSWRPASVLAALIAVALGLCAGCSPRPRLYLNDPSQELADSGKSICFIALDSIRVEYVDKTQATPDTLLTDSFFLEAANNLLIYEASNQFKLSSGDQSDSPDSSALLRTARYSRIAKDESQGQRVAEIMKKTAAANRADLVLSVYSCTLKHIIYQPSGWRGSGPSYDRPVTFQASAKTHVQIWNKEGILLYEAIGTNDAGRPIMYTLFGKKKLKEDIVKLAKNLYAPPLVRALYHSIQAAMRFGQPANSIFRKQPPAGG